MAYRCRFCGLTSDTIDDFEVDHKNHLGFWCPDCDGFTYFAEEDRSYILCLEDKGLQEMHKKADFPVHVSPLRYPGGKSKLTQRILNSCRPGHMENFIEPFAGGASVGLALLLAGKVKNLYLNDMDYGIYSLFKVIKENPDELKERIYCFSPTNTAYARCQEKVLCGYSGQTELDAAWCLLVTNRLAFSGIAFANCMREPKARWNAKTLCRRIDKIHQAADRIFVYNQDAAAFIEEMYWMDNATMLADPPYFDKGQVLYPHEYSEGDHYMLSRLLDELHKGLPGADIIITYDHVKDISDMYLWPKECIIGRKYSIACA